MDTVQQHCLLASDKLGQSRYRQAIFQTVKAGDLVLDLGTGTGIHALFSCQAGAGYPCPDGTNTARIVSLFSPSMTRRNSVAL